MEEHTQIKFLNQFIKMIKSDDVKRVGIITDKDGTILLDNSLREILKDFREKHLGVQIYLIANSGRTIQDMINCLEEQNIPTGYFDYIIGDNGGMCLDVKANKLLYKHIMERNIVSKVIQMFLKMGGTLENIRIADGKSIYAYPSQDVQEYYRNSKDIEFREDITYLEGIDISKLTLSGRHGLIDSLNKYVRENIKGYRTHIGKTSFPLKERNNYRMDFTGMHTKGEAAKDLKKMLSLDTCIYLGNDLNDISMFSVAIDDNDFIVIANNEHQEIPKSIVNYLQEECKVKGINWEDVKLLVLEEENVNKFLRNICKILAVTNSSKKKTQEMDIRNKYKVSIRPITRPKNRRKQKRRETYSK